MGLTLLVLRSCRGEVAPPSSSAGFGESRDGCREVCDLYFAQLSHQLAKVLPQLFAEMGDHLAAAGLKPDADPPTVVGCNFAADKAASLESLKEGRNGGPRDVEQVRQFRVAHPLPDRQVAEEAKLSDGQTLAVPHGEA